MKNKQLFKNVLAFTLGIMLTSFFILLISNNRSQIQKQSTYLSQPIASEKILITSAGQSTDTYIIKDVANNLLLENAFKPNAEASDLNDINSIVVVVAHSDIGEVLHDIDHEKEYKRVEELIKSAKEKELAVIGVYIGGKMRDNKKTNQLIDLVFSNSTYNFVVGEEKKTKQLADISEVPMIYVANIQQIKGPFSSLFR